MARLSEPVKFSVPVINEPLTTVADTNNTAKAAAPTHFRKFIKPPKALDKTLFPMCRLNKKRPGEAQSGNRQPASPKLEEISPTEALDSRQEDPPCSPQRGPCQTTRGTAVIWLFHWQIESYESFRLEMSFEERLKGQVILHICL